MSNDARPEHVADQLIFMTVPREKRWTRTAAAVEFRDVLHFVGGDFNFILQNASRPQHADYIGLFRLAKADGQVGRVLPQIAGRSVNFKLLPQASGEDFDFRADGGLVIVQAFERQTQRVVLVAAFVAEQNGGAVILRDQEIDGAVVVIVSGDDDARIFELNLVEAYVGGDVFPSVRAEIAKEANFTATIFCFANGGQVDPAVVVVVDGDDAEGADPIDFRQRDLVEGFALIVPPERDAGRARVSERDIHPAVVIEIKYRHTHR